MITFCDEAIRALLEIRLKIGTSYFHTVTQFSLVSFFTFRKGEQNYATICVM